MDHTEVVGRALFLARSNAPELFEPVDQTLDEVAATVGGAVEVWLPTLVALARDHRPEMTSAQAAPCGRATVAFVAGHTPRPQTGSAPTGTSDRALVQQRLERNLLMPLTASQHCRDRPAMALGPQVQLGREAALAAAQRLPGLRLTPR